MYADDLVRVVVTAMSGNVMFEGVVHYSRTLSDISNFIKEQYTTDGDMTLNDISVDDMHYVVGSSCLRGDEILTALEDHATQPELPWRDEIHLKCILVNPAPQ